MTRPAVFLLALLVALPAAGEIYSWKDKDGRTHYSDVPPLTGEVKTLRAAPPRPTAPAQSEIRDDANASSNPAVRERKSAEADADAETREADRQRFCEQARNQLTALQSGQRMARLNEKGEPEFLDDAARAEEAARIQRQIDQVCNN